MSMQTGMQTFYFLGVKINYFIIYYLMDVREYFKSYRVVYFNMVSTNKEAVDKSKLVQLKWELG